MKRLFLSFTLALIFLISGLSQLTVADDNNVGIAETSPASELSINGVGNTSSTLYVQNNTTTSNQRAAQFYKSASGDNGSDYSYAVLGHIAQNGGYKLVGGHYLAHSSNLSSNRTFGLYGRAGNGLSGFNYGVFGYLSGTRNGAAIYGCINGAEANVGGRYAGYFTDDVKIDADLYVTGSYNPSDINLKKEIRALSTEETKQLEKLRNLSAIKYKYKTPVELNSIPSSIADTMKVDPRTIEYTADRYTKDQIGFSAQEVQQVYPELVKEGQDGYLSINYIGLIPVLVEAIKEQDSTIEELNQTVQSQDSRLQTQSETLQIQEIILQTQAEILQTQELTLQAQEDTFQLQAEAIKVLEGAVQMQEQTILAMDEALKAQADDIKILKEEVDKLKNPETTK